MKEATAIIAPLIVGFLRYFLMAGIPFLIVYILFPKIFKGGKIQRRLAGRKDFLREIGHSVQSTLTITGVALLFLLTPIREYTLFYTDLASYPLWWFPVSIVLALVVHDTYFYWMHRTVHHPKLFRSIHLTHHQSVNPSPWASYSFHFFEAILEGMIAPVLLFLIPLHPTALLVFATTSFFINVYGHLGYEISPLWLRRTWLFELLNTSVHHNLHHSKFDGNYGLYFRVWDRIMGTELPDYVREYDRVQESRLKAHRKTSIPETRSPSAPLLSDANRHNATL